MDTKPCLFCDKQLESALPADMQDDFSFQPHAGGEVKFEFHYGSTKFDLDMHGTKFKALICDDCASKYVDKMDLVSPN